MRIKTRHTKYILAALMALFSISASFGQEGTYIEVQDFETWSSVELRYKLPDYWTFGLQQQVRLNYNSTQLKGYFTQLGIDFKPSKHWALGIGLRYITMNDNEGNVQGLEYYFRYHLDAAYMHKADRFSFKYRFRYQNRNEIGLSAEEGDVPLNYTRLRVKVDYNIKNWKLDPVLSGEIFNGFENGENLGITHYRISFGTDIKTKNAGKIGVYYRLEEEVNTGYPKTIHAIRLKYIYTIKGKKKDD